MHTLRSHKRCTTLLLACLLLLAAPRSDAVPSLDKARLSAAGIRQLESQHLTLFTDLPSDPDVDSLPELFDQAVPQFCEYLGVDPHSVADWKLTGCLMANPARFRSVGLVDQDTPAFQHGYSLDHRFWLNEQPTPYSRRHLLLHEATHAFMNTLLGDSGPPWYREGIAELLATHHLSDNRLQLGYFPQHREEVPMWGRIKMVQENVRDGRVYTVADLLQAIPGDDRTTDGYGWVWALCSLLDGHPRYQERFRQLPAHVNDEQFTERFRELYATDWRELELEWRLFVNELDFAFDLNRATIEFDAPGLVDDSPADTFSIDTDRGWQSTGITIEPNVTYRIGARGQFEVAQHPEPWISEPQGVSIEYYRGRPLGQLLAAVRPDDQSTPDAKSFLDPIPVGAGTRIRSSRRGTLFLRINESPARLDDNRGEIEVRVAPE